MALNSHSIPQILTIDLILMKMHLCFALSDSVRVCWWKHLKTLLRFHTDCA